MMDETALDVLTRAATLVETDAAKHLAQGEDKATVHPVDFSSAIDHRNNNNSDLSCHYEQLPSAGLRLKRRQHERRSTEKSVKRCFTEDLQKVNCYTDTKENLSVCDYLSEADDDQQLSDEDTGKLVVDDNVEEDKEADSDRELKENSGDDIKSSTQRGRRHSQRVNHADSDEEANERVRIVEKCMGRRVERQMKEDEDEDEVEDDEQTAIEDAEEQEGPLDMTTNNRSRNQNNDNPPRWSPSSSTSSSSPPAAVNMPPIFYSHPPRYNPYVSSAPPPPYHPLPHHHLSRPHSASPPPYLPPSYATGNHYPDALTTNTSTNGHRNISSSLRPAHTLQQHRPSVITCASTSTNKTPPPTAIPSPPTHHQHHHRHAVSNSNSVNHHYHPSQHHHRSCSSNIGSSDAIEATNVGAISRRTLSDPTASRAHLTNSSTNNSGGHSKSRRSSDHTRYGHRREILSGMCDPVIDEHFRRSLGKHYTEYLSSSTASKTPLVTNKNSSDSAGTNMNSTSSTSSISITGMSVDDHFAKALGETWLRLQNKGLNSSSSSSNTCNSPTSKPSSPTTSVASTYASSSASPKSVSPSPAVQPTQQRHSLVST